MLTNARAKLWRGCEQFHALNTELRAAFDTPDNFVEFDFKSEVQERPPGIVDNSLGWRAVTLYVSDVRPFEPTLGLRLGEALLGFRGCLDHLAWELWRRRGRKGLTERQKTGIQFPLARTHQTFLNQWNQRLPGVPTAPFQTILGAYQPYRRTPAGRAMRALRKLSDTDKHRVLLPTLLLPAEGNFDIHYEGAALIDRFMKLRKGREVKVGMEIMTLVLAKVRKSVHLTATGEGRFQPMFPTSLVRPAPHEDATTVQFTLEEVARYCLQVVNEVEAQL